jgi:hypothetical protein
MARIGCADEDSSPYPGYDLAAVGANVCVYRARGTHPGGAPVVRFLSFNYDLNHGESALRGMRADHDLLARELARDTRVVLDVHQNHGGANPFLFLSWFAHAPWGHPLVHVRVSDAFSDDQLQSLLWGDGGNIAAYKQARSRGDREVSFYFLCHGDCEKEGPRVSELVTRAPVALVTGPECISSCDSIAVTWSAFHLGPIVGKQPMHAFTTVRHELPVTGPDHADLGTFRVALSWDAFAGKPPLEGQTIALDWEAPEAFATRDTWVADAVAHAERLLRTSR